MENQQPTGEAQNSQKKAWYRSGWGLVIAILFFPYFLLWYMWAKTNWSKGAKIVITIVFVFFNIVALASDNTNQQAEQKPSITEKKGETPATQQPQAPKFVFDIPALIGKNIDEVVQALGKPSIDMEPTKQQLETGIDEWEKEFKKDENSLLVTYNPKTKVVIDFFISGTDRKALLIIGNLKENNSNYVIEFVKAITNPSDITGVKVSKKLAEELSGNVNYSAVAFKIENKEDYNWTNCKFSINSKFDFRSTSGIKAKDSLIIPFSEFTNDGERFNFFINKPENIFISCDTLGQHRTNYFTIN